MKWECWAGGIYSRVVALEFFSTACLLIDYTHLSKTGFTVFTKLNVVKLYQLTRDSEMRILIGTMLSILACASANACFLKSETNSGMNKICIYDCVDGERAITISATSLCPLSLYKELDGDAAAGAFLSSINLEGTLLQMSPIADSDVNCLVPVEEKSPS